MADYTSESLGGLILAGESSAEIRHFAVIAESSLILSGESFSKVNPEAASGGFVLSGTSDSAITSVHVVPIGGLNLEGDSNYGISDAHFESEGGIVLEGDPNYGVSSVHLESEGGFSFGGSTSPSVYFIVNETYTWNVNGIIQKDQTFTWDVGNQILHYYTVEGVCAKPPTCDVHGLDLGDNTCGIGGMRFSQTLAATSVADLCVKMKEVSLNWPIKWPISKIRKHSRPVYLSDVSYTSDPNTSIVRLNNGSTVQTTTINGVILVTVRSTVGNASTTTQAPSPTGTVKNVLPDGTIVTTKLTNGIVSTVTIESNGSTSTQYGNSVEVLSTQGAQDVTISGQIKQQLNGVSGTSASFACNTLEDQVYCQIPECFDFCVNEDHTVGITVNVFYSDQFYNVQASGGLTLNGRITPKIDSNTDPVGGFILGGSAEAKCDYFSYVASDRGLMLSSDNEVTSSAWNYIGESNLIIAGSSITSYSSYNYNSSGTLYFSGDSNVIYRLNPNVNFTFNLGGSSNTNSNYNYISVSNANLSLSGTTIHGSDYYQIESSGGLSLGSNNDIVSPSWSHISDANLTLSGYSLIKYRTEANGGVSLGGSADVGMHLKQESSSGLIVSGSSIIGSSSAYSWNNSSGLQLSGVFQPSWINLGDFTVQFYCTSEILLFEPVFASSDSTVNDFAADTGVVVGNCGCNPIPIKLKMQHNFNETTILKDFLNRNNLSFPSIINLIYNSQDSSWRSTNHFRGAGSEALEEWHVIIEWICGTLGENINGSASWNLSVLVTRVKKTTPIEKYETRLLYSFEPSAACDDDKIKFSFTINTNTEQVITPKTLIVSESLIHDGIGLFIGKQWQKIPKLKIDISSLDTFVSTPQKDIYSLF